jgi:hypothetical protein
VNEAAQSVRAENTDNSLKGAEDVSKFENGSLDDRLVEPRIDRVMAGR